MTDTTGPTEGQSHPVMSVMSVVSMPPTPGVTGDPRFEYQPGVTPKVRRAARWLTVAIAVQPRAHRRRLIAQLEAAVQHQENTAVNR